MCGRGIGRSKVGVGVRIYRSAFSPLLFHDCYPGAWPRLLYVAPLALGRVPSALEFSVFELMEGVAECGDFQGGVVWGELAGVEGEFGFGHGEG